MAIPILASGFLVKSGKQMLSYDGLILRNHGYINDETQAKIRATRLLVAGCGIGSSFAEAAVRLGFENITLADGDTVAASNLNRQNFTADDIGKPKVEALARRLRAINPAADIQEFNAYLTPESIVDKVAKADLVFDTIDFLDLAAIVALHDECRRQRKPAITALAVGWGAGCIYFPVGCEYSFRRVFGLQEEGSVEHMLYVDMFAPLIKRLENRLDSTVFKVVNNALKVMEDGTPCPASQVSPGAFSVGALGATLAMRILANLPVLAAPHLLLADMQSSLIGSGIDLSN